MIELIVTGLVVLAGFVAYKLWKSNKAITGASVIAGVETDVKSAANTAINDVANNVIKKL